MGSVHRSCVWLLVLQACGLVSGETLYMDSNSVCGSTRTVGLNSIIIEPRGLGGIANPPANCILQLESAFQESNYDFEIVLESAAFVDCGLTLNIFNGFGVGGSYIRQFGCSTRSSTDQFYSNNRAITLQLTRSRDQYILGSHFSLNIKAYKNENAGPIIDGTSSLSVGVIIGIVLGVVVLVAFAILLGWCYKTGHLGFGDEYPPEVRKSGDDGTNGINGNDNGTFVSWNMKRDTDKLSVTTASRSNFDLDDPRMWDSLTAASDTKGDSRDNARVLKSGNTGGRSVNDDYYNTTSLGEKGRGGRYDARYNNNNARDGGRFNRADTEQMSSSPGSRNRGRREDSRGRSTRDDKYENVDYNKDRELGSGRGRGPAGGSSNQTGANKEGKETSAGLFKNPDKEGYLYDYEHVKSLSGDDKQEGAQKTTDFESELKNAIKRNSLKHQQSSTDNEAPSAPSSQRVSGESADTDLSSSNPLIDKQGGGGPDAHSSPKSKKKLKRKSSKERKSPKSSRKHDNTDVSHSPKSKHRTADEESVPPEAYAPIFSEDENLPSYVPTNQYQPGYQGAYPPAPYGQAYPVGAYPYPGMGGGPPGAPFQQAGQAQWFMEATPTGQQKMAFAMTTHSQGSQDDSLQAQYGDGNHPGMPGYTSTPYNRAGNQALVPAGTVLDDPQVPPPGTSLVRYDDDPLTGIKTSQVIWTDAKRDPTDPPPDSNPQVTRKTITRLTTKSGKDNIPDAPNPSMQDMTYRTAQQIQASGGEPAFMSPSHGAVHYTPNAIQYASQTPERANSGFYTAGTPHVRTIPGSPTPVIHEAPTRNEQIRDRITMSTADD